ncbi:MAG: phosphatidylserine/phosphatidylglycerophosphate/cardiolipin synthase family protein [Sphaerochaetaceae bacterium]|nr:phosphatidylserine/phosphatidylglycerophosphate/cardiolipin synthase family protein [Sphaerochaetaceae bacterium]
MKSKAPAQQRVGAFIVPFTGICAILPQMKVCRIPSGQPTVVCLLLIFLLVFCSCTTPSTLENTRLGMGSPTSYMEQNGIPAYQASLPVLYHTGVEWNKRALQMIKEAQDYLLIDIFLGNLHYASVPVWEALADKVAQGVRVYCMFDSSSYFQVDPKTQDIVPAVLNYLRELGIPVVEYNPFSMSHTAFLPLLLDRDHRKFWIVDGKRIAVGGININYASLALPPETGNIDSMAEFSSPGVIRAMVDSFVETWNRYDPRQLDVSDFTVDVQADNLDTSVWLIDHHWPARSQTTVLFDAFTLGAQKELWMVQGFAFLTHALIDRIANAVSRGVDVHIILSENAGKEHYEKAALYGILDLLDVGAHVYIYRDPGEAFLHLKLMVADKHLTVFGSTNYNLRSQTLSREISVVYDDKRLGEMAMDHIEHLMKYARMVDREEALKYRTFGGYLNYLLMQVWG